MGTFFKGWRPKIGVLTLAMACAFAVGWVRSHFSDDRISLKLATGAFGARSNWKSLLVFRSQLVEGLSNLNTPNLTLHSDPTKNDHRRPLPETHWFNNGLEITWRIDGFGFHAGRAEYIVEKRTSAWTYYCVMPYWSIVLPLTMLSAWLLLGKSESGKRSPREN
jgi:hypothetical protein